MPFDAAPQYLTLSAMITPALFMTASGSLIISTSNRMSRVVDRIRAINDLGDQIDRGASGLDYTAERLEYVADQRRRLRWRGERIRIALMVLYLAFGLFVGTSLGLALDVLFGHGFIASLPTALAVAGVALMLVACVNLVREALEALRSMRAEAAFFEGLQSRRSALAATADSTS